MIKPSNPPASSRERCAFTTVPRQVAWARVATKPADEHMVYRKGELEKRMIDREWPHQVALPAERCSGHNYVTIHLFCDGLSLCPRGHFFRRSGIDMHVFCFAQRAHAEQFQERFGGEFVNPKDRPRWPRPPR
jgi:hypothetical protein